MSFTEIFDAHFSKYKDKKISIYGLGENARTLLTEASGYNFSVLVAKDHIGETFWGMKVFDIKSALEVSDMLIIAATQQATNIIYRRIRNIIPHDFPIFDIRGNELSSEDSYKQNPYWSKNKNNLIASIGQYDVISFDVFDTLIMRRTLFPSDIFKLVEYRVEKYGVFNFFHKRLKAEQIVFENNGYTDLTLIYDELMNTVHMDSRLAETVKKCELNIEKEMVCPRQDVVDVLFAAKTMGKTVIITSDMYLSEQDIAILLNRCGTEIGIECLYQANTNFQKQTVNCIQS